MKLLWIAHIDLDADGVFERDLQPGEIKQASLRAGIDEDVEVAAVDVVAVEGGAEEARVAHAVLEDEPANGIAVLREGFGRLHASDCSVRVR